MTKAEKTRQFIIEQTAPIFNKKGYAGTSLQDITTATGLTKGSIYGNFGSKDEVALAVFDHNIKIVGNIFEEAKNRHTTIRGKLMAYVEVYMNWQKHPFPQGGCPMQNTAVEADDTHPALKKKALEAVNTWKKRIISLVEEGIDRNEIRKTDVNPEQFALTMIATIEGMQMISRLTGKPEHRKLILDAIAKSIEALF